MLASCQIPCGLTPRLFNFCFDILHVWWFRLSLGYFWLKICLHNIAPRVAMEIWFRCKRSIGKRRFTSDFMSSLVSLVINLLLWLISADRRDELCSLWVVHCSGVTMGRWNWRTMYPWSMKQVQTSAWLVIMAYRRGGGGGEGLQVETRVLSRVDILGLKSNSI